MTIEELLVIGKGYCHSDHAKILLAELLNKNPLELLNCLEELVPPATANTYQEAVKALSKGRTGPFLDPVQNRGAEYEET